MSCALFDSLAYTGAADQAQNGTSSSSSPQSSAADQANSGGQPSKLQLSEQDKAVFMDDSDADDSDLDDLDDNELDSLANRLQETAVK